MIDGVTSRPFSAATLPPIKVDTTKGVKQSIIDMSRKLYTNPREEVEDAIEKWSGSLQGAGDEVGDKFKATCSSCKKETLVPFEPKKGLPVYCGDCLKKIKTGELKPLRGFVGGGNAKKEVSKTPLSMLGIEFQKDGTRVVPGVQNNKSKDGVRGGKKILSYRGDKKVKRNKPSPMLKGLLNKIGLSREEKKEIKSIEDLPLEEVKEEPKEAMSLSVLDKSNKKDENTDENNENKKQYKDTKTASQEKLNELKDLLTSVQDTKKEEDKTISTPSAPNAVQGTSPLAGGDNEEDTQDKKGWQKRVPKDEVPEDVLRKVLE